MMPDWVIAVIVGIFTLAGSFIGAWGARKQIEDQHRFQQREHVRQQREDLYNEILYTVRRVVEVFAHLEDWETYRNFKETIQSYQSKEEASDIRLLEVRLNLLGSIPVFALFIALMSDMRTGYDNIVSIVDRQGIDSPEFGEIAHYFRLRFLRLREDITDRMRADLIGAGLDVKESPWWRRLLGIERGKLRGT
ncbi:MAG: hypothetical protein ACE5JP_15905 [Candidatus Bipolaricaulia bacterium]